MSDVPKPWQRNLVPSKESADITSNPLRNNILTTGVSTSNSAIPHSSPYAAYNNSRLPAAAPAPPLPARPGRPDYSMGGQMGYGYGSMGMGYSPYMQHFSGGYSGGYGGGYSGGYGGGYSGGYGGGLGETSENSFVRDAQEGTRSAFSAIETIVRAVGSVAIMLESTYLALSTSFRAILGLADHFSQLKTSLFGVISGLSILYKVRNWIHRLLVLLKVRSPLRNAEFDSVWQSSALAGAGEITSVEQLVPDHKLSLWPFLSFFTVILALPYLLWRLTKSFTGSKAETDDFLWAEGKDEHVLLKANHSFQGQPPRELSFNEGDILIAAPKHKQPHVRGWLLACIDQNVGLIPANYMSIVGVRKSELPLEQN
ncbi:Peroxisomal membrane protein PEX13-like isoform X1 [Oopsacas minuta]|uniref:Peroxisomal membrane protein PEX13 n=1 Tax=Oopsacas minuta TaxID=111878 RepID=A0AAV7KDK6_9METZ|nr:Peroxisomal membrane protein PEX13-like isoform X1 [Oopsacas minuta]